MSRVVAKGRFRVDRRRALEKMEKFQLEDPLRYVLEWVAAAVVSGAERIDLRNDSDDTELWWSGPDLERDALDGLFDHLFGRPAGPREALLQHLGIGVLGALARSPRWLHIDAGPWRLAVDDPARTQAVALDPPFDGVRCHVRDALTRETVVEAMLLAFRDPAEARMVRGAARWCPVPIHINGQRVPPPEPPLDALFGTGTDERALWVVPGSEGHGVDVVRHGIVVHTLDRPLGPCRVVGWIRADGVRLNASRSAVVDGDRAAVEQALDAALDAWLPQAVATAWSGRRDEVVRWQGPAGTFRRTASRAELLEAVAHTALARAGGSPGPLAPLQVLADARGRRWSIDALRPVEVVGWSDGPVPGSVPDTWVVFPSSLTGALVALPQGRDLSEALAEHVALEARRARIESSPKLPWTAFRRVPDRTGQVGPWRIGLSIDRSRRSSQAKLELRTDDRLVGESQADGLGLAWLGVVDGPFRLGGYEAFRDDDAFRDAMAAVGAEQWRAIAAHLEAGRGDLDVLVAVLEDQVFAPFGIDDAVRRVGALPEGVGHVPCWPWQGRLRSTVEMLQGAPPRFVVSTVPEGCPSDLLEATLVVPLRWVRTVGERLRAEHVGDEALAKAVRVAHRRRAPREAARLVPAPALVVDHARDGLSGQLGARGTARRVVDRIGHRLPQAAPAEASGTVRVLWQGLFVGEVPVPELSGVHGVVEGADLETDDELRLTEAGARRVARWAEQATRELVPKLWDDVPDGERLPEGLLRWLARFGGTLPGPERDRPVLQRVQGPPMTLGEVLQLDRRRKGERKLVVLARGPGDLPGFDDAVLAEGAERALLEALSRRGWKDGTDDLAQARDLHRRFVEQPPVPAPQRPLWEHEEVDDGLSLRFYLPSEPVHCGSLKVVALHHGRTLAVRSSATRPGLLLHVEGMAPNRRCTDVEDGTRLTALKRRAESGLPGAVRAVLVRGLDAASRPALRRTAVRVKEAAGGDRMWRKLARDLGAAPLLQRLDGGLCSVADVQAWIAAGHEVHRVAPSTPRGPTDHERYLVDGEAVADLVEAWTGRRLSDATVRLAVWREGQRRRATAQKVQPRRHGAHVRPLQGEGFSGFLSIAVGTPRLRIDPIHEGVDLEAFDRVFPIGALASVEGSATVPSADWRTASRAGALGDAVVACCIEAIDAWVADGAVPETEAIRWVAWRGLEAPTATVPVLPLASGDRVALADAMRWSEVGYVRRRLPPMDPDWVGLVLDDREVRAWLEPLRGLVDHSGLQRRRTEVPRAVPQGDVVVQRVPGGHLWVADVDAPRVELLHGNVPVGWMAAPAGVPVEGVVSDPAVRPGPDGEAPREGPALEALEARLAGWERSLAERLVARLPDPAARRLLRTGALRRLASGGLRSLREHPCGSAPLVRDTHGRWGSLLEVLDGSVVRAASPGTRGGLDDGRVWCLDVELRAALARFAPIVDAEAALARAQQLRQRRAERAVRLPPVPEGAVTGEVEGARFALWTAARPGVDRIWLVDRGAHLDDLDLGVGGLEGFVAGELPTDEALERVRLPKASRRALEAAAVEVMQRLWADDPERFAAWVRTGREPQQGRWDGLLGQVVVARDGRGRGVRLGSLGRSVPPWSGSRAGPAGALVGTDAQRADLERLLGRMLDTAPDPERVQWRADLMAETLGLLGRDDEAIDGLLDRLPATLRTDGRGPAGHLLAAWWIASRCVPPDEETALVEKLAVALRDRRRERSGSSVVVE